ncbi:serine-threonine protein kinase 19-domain-containing protein [Halenospora varia]|nr:serine-threonine protein kinase 19-domain-containing protein [Halenospora varia]
MSFKASAAHSSRIKKSSKAPSFKRSSSGSSPYSSFQRRKPIQRAATKPEFLPEDDDFFDDRLDDLGLVQALSTDLTLRDISQAIIYIKGKMWTQMPERAGMNSTRIAEVLNFRASLPPIVTVSHLQALLNSPTAVEKEIAELSRGGTIKKIVVGGRGNLGEALILSQDLDRLIAQSDLEQAVKQRFTTLLHENLMALKIPRRQVSDEDARLLMHRGFLTTSDNTWTTIDVFSAPGEGSRGTMTSLNSISKAASGSLEAVGGQGAVIAAGGSGGGIKPSSGIGDYSLALPATGPFLKLLSNARSHLLSLLSKSKYKEAPESLLRQRWDGGIATDDGANAARRNRGEFTGVLPGRTRKWKQFYGISFEWILGECVGAGLVEVFNTGSIGRGIRAL